VAENAWVSSDGTGHLILVAVAEVKDDCHACAVILGVGQFRRLSSSDAWHNEVLTPAAGRVGGYGVFGGKVSFVEGGLLGRVVMLEDFGGGTGEFGSVALIFAVANGSFREVLMVPLSLSIDGTCDSKEAECRKRVAQSNYDPKLAFAVGEDGKLRVDQTFTAAIPVLPASWVVEGNGFARQIAGGKVSPGANAEERVTLADPAFDQGRADRVAYEAWFSGLQAEKRADAESWVGRRSLRASGNCEPPVGLFDARRKTESKYRRGWNSL